MIDEYRKLKACPFCGSPHVYEVNEISADNDYYVKCNCCSAEVHFPLRGNSREGIMIGWNKRTNLVEPNETSKIKITAYTFNPSPIQDADKTLKYVNINGQWINIDANEEGAAITVYPNNVQILIESYDTSDNNFQIAYEYALKLYGPIDAADNKLYDERFINT